MATIYVKEQGAYIKRQGNYLIVTKDNETLHTHSILHVENLVIYGHVQMTSQATLMLLDNGIDITYLTTNGRYKGQIQSNTSKNIFLRLAQHSRYRDKTFRLGISKSIISAKIQNQINIIRRFNWGNEDESWKTSVERMAQLIDELEAKTEIGGIMGVEGAASSIYFSWFGKAIKSDFEFTKRVRRPATDPVNALLNLGYTFLTNEMDSVFSANSIRSI